MQPVIENKNLEQPITLTSLFPTVRMLPTLDKVRLIRILAEDVEEAKEIWPFEAGKTYYLATPYDSFGAASVLAETLADHKKDSC